MYKTFFAINFVDYYLSKGEYSHNKAAKYVRYWYRKDVLSRLVKKHNIEKIEFNFRK